MYSLIFSIWIQLDISISDSEPRAFLIKHIRIVKLFRVDKLNSTAARQTFDVKLIKIVYSKANT